jgi:hypothetical protein
VLVGVGRGRVFHHRDVIAEFGGITNGGLHNSYLIRRQPDNLQP